MSTLGIDIGTTGCKVAAYADDGQLLGFAYRDYELLRPRPGWCELPARAMWRELQSAIREVAAHTTADPVRALCVSSLGEAMTPVNAAGEILADCIVSSDSRGTEYADALTHALPSDEFYRINPNRISPNYSLPKLAWLRDHAPELYRQTDQFLLWDGLVSRLLGGESFASYSLANRTLLFDIRREDWSPVLLRQGGIDPVKLPRCVPAGAVTGEVSAGMAQRLGLPRGVKIVAGGHDQCLNALGSGITQAGGAAAGLGTYECITPVYAGLDRLEDLRGLGLNIEHYVIPGLYVSFLFNQAGSLIRWFRETFASGDAGASDESLQREMPDAPTDLLVLPYFEPTGSPCYVNDASGVILGLKMHTRRGEILKAIMESTSFYFLESWKRLRGSEPAGEIIASGGGARSDQWLQIKADIFGVPVCRPRTTECGALGAAMLAAAAVSGGEDLGAQLRARVATFVQIEKRFEPDTERHRRYQSRADYYQGVFPALYGQLSGWHRLTTAS